MCSLVPSCATLIAKCSLLYKLFFPQQLTWRYGTTVFNNASSATFTASASRIKQGNSKGDLSLVTVTVTVTVTNLSYKYPTTLI